MAFGQVDPASLEGEALMRWYRRTPQEIEEERRRAAAGAYDRFFYPTRSDPSSESHTAPFGHQSSAENGALSLAAGPNWQTNSWRDSRATSLRGPSSGGGAQLAAAPSPGFWDYWGLPGCANCHGYKPNTLPPYGGHSPFPPSVAPRSGNPGGSSPRRRDKHPQCEMQDRSDRGICAEQPTAKAQAVCNESATERRAWCDAHEGEIGHPPLFRARRKSGRPWP